MRVRNPLPVEEEAVDAVRIAKHLHRAPADVRQHAVGHLKVVAGEVPFGQISVRKVDLVEVRQLDFSRSDAHFGRA
jgi:hypothetical protein